MISWRAYWCFGAAVIVGAAATLLAVFAVPLIPAAAGLALTAVVTITMARKEALFGDAFSGLSVRARQQAAGWITAGIITHIVWVLLVVLRPDLWLVWVVVLAALCATSNGAVAALTYTFTKLQPKIEAQKQQQQLESARAAQQLTITGVQAVAAAPPDPNDPVEIARRTFGLRGYGWLEIAGWSTIGQDGESIGIAYRVRVPASIGSSRSAVTRTELTGADVEPLAIAFSRVLGIELQSNWVHIRKEPGAGIYTISVCTVDALRKVYPYQDVPRWIPQDELMPIGHRIDGTVVTANIAQHVADTGQTRSGKTSLIHRKWAYITLRRRSVLWVGGVEKLFDAVGPWIEPYLGTNEKIPFGAIANGPKDTLEMLVCAMAIGRWRQTVPHKQRADFVDLFVQLDEASFFLVLNKVTSTYQGISVNPTTIACMIVKGVGSAHVYLHLAAQRGTNNNWGDMGGDISANIGMQTVFRTSDPGEVGRATGDWKTPPPVHQGEFLYTPGLGEPVERLKAEYIQETDPNKPTLHDGSTLSEVAWARRHFVQQLDPGSERVAREASEWYRNRATSADDVYEYLTGMVIDLSEHESAEYTAAYEKAAAEMRAKLAAAGIPLKSDTAEPAAAGEETAAPSESATASATVTPLASRPKPLKSWIEDVVADAGEPLGRAGIIEALEEAGYQPPNGGPINPQQVTNALGELVRDNRLVRDREAQTYESTRISA